MSDLVENPEDGVFSQRGSFGFVTMQLKLLETDDFLVGVSAHINQAARVFILHNSLVIRWLDSS